MPRFKAIRDDRLEKASEEGRESANRLDDGYEIQIAEDLKAIGQRVVEAINWDMPNAQALIAASEKGREELNSTLNRMLVEAFALGVTNGKEAAKLVAPVTKADATLLTNWDMPNEDVLAWAENQFAVSQRGAALLPGLQATEANRIRQLMAGYVEDKRSQRWLINRLVGETGLYTRNRARLIARTEVTNMYAQGNLIAWGNRGVKEYSWRTRFDERVCEICGPLHQQHYDLDSNIYPPAHVACRCWIVPYHNWAATQKEWEKQQAAIAEEESKSVWEKTKYKTHDMPLARGAQWKTLNTPKGRELLKTLSEGEGPGYDRPISKEIMEKLMGFATDDKHVMDVEKRVYFGLKGEKFVNMKPGDTFSALGTRSTTTERVRALTYGGNDVDPGGVFEVLLPKGTRAVNAEVLGIDEIMMLPGAKYRVVGYKDGFTQLVLESDGSEYIKELNAFLKELDDIAIGKPAPLLANVNLGAISPSSMDFAEAERFRKFFNRTKNNGWEETANAMTEVFHDESIERAIQRDIFRNWQLTSNNDFMSLSNQKAISEVFEVDLSDWQKEQIEKWTAKRAAITDPKEFRSHIQFGTMSGSFELDVILPKLTIRSLEEAEAIRKKAVLAIYNDTQKTLKANKFETLRVYRGVRLENVDLYEGDLVDLGSNALESWTTDIKIAKRFAKEDGYVLEADVPIARVFGYGSKGMGTRNEAEVVLLGKQKGIVDQIRVAQGKVRPVEVKRPPT